MERPKEINKLAKVSLILSVLAVAAGVLLTYFPNPAVKLILMDTEIKPQSPGTVHTAMLMSIACYLPVLIMSAISKSRDKLSHDLAIVTIIVTVLARPLSLAISVLGSQIVLRMGSAEDLAFFSAISRVVSLISGTLHGIGFMILISAAAIELYECSRRKEGTKDLSEN
jgi:hypothetical protein